MLSALLHLPLAPMATALFVIVGTATLALTIVSLVNALRAMQRVELCAQRCVSRCRCDACTCCT